MYPTKKCLIFLVGAYVPCTYVPYLCTMCSVGMFEKILKLKKIVCKSFYFQLLKYRKFTLGIEHSVYLFISYICSKLKY